MNWRDYINRTIEPSKGNVISRVYDIMMLFAIIAGITPLIFRTQYHIFVYLDIISGGCFIFDYILRWATCDIRTNHHKWWSFIVYPFTPMAIIDLLSILPTINMLAPIFKMTRLSRLLRILRVIKIIRYFEPLEIILAVIRKQRTILLTVLSLAVFYIFVTAMIMFNAEEEINPETGKYLFNNFFDAFYWAACTLTTVGYGDLYPISDIGRIISVLSSLVGIAIIALPSGIITAGYMEELRMHKSKFKGNIGKMYK